MLIFFFFFNICKAVCLVLFSFQNLFSVSVLGCSFSILATKLHACHPPMPYRLLFMLELRLFFFFSADYSYGDSFGEENERKSSSGGGVSAGFGVCFPSFFEREIAGHLICFFSALVSLLYMIQRHALSAFIFV